jgi:hypothetical protein
MTMARPYAEYYPYGINLFVPNCALAADIELGQSLYVANFGAPLALSAAGLINSVVMVNGSAVTVTAFTAGAGSATEIGYNGMVPYTSLTKRDGWGRNITAVASSTNTRVMTVAGYDYIGQPMQETITLTSGSTAQGNKAFAWVTSISFASAADTTTVNVGWGNKFGLPYAGTAMVNESKNGAVAANAGTFTAALADGTAATISNADTKGTYLPVTVIPDGVNTFEVVYTLRRGNLHGNRAYSA